MSDDQKQGKILQIVLALIAATATILVGYWQFGAKNDEVESTTPFVGRIIDANTATPIISAKVSLDTEGIPPVQYTDVDGIFSFPLKDIDSHVRIRVEARGYDPFTRRIKPDASEEIQDIRLEPMGAADEGKLVAPLQVELGAPKSESPTRPIVPPTAKVLVTIESEIQGCRLYIDEKYYGRVPQTVSIEQGRRRIRLQGQNLVFAREVEVSQAKKLSIASTDFSFIADQ